MAMAGADTQIEETAVCGYASTRVDGKRPSHSGRHLQARRGALVALPVHGRWHNPLKEYNHSNASRNSEAHLFAGQSLSHMVGRSCGQPSVHGLPVQDVV